MPICVGGEELLVTLHKPHHVGGGLTNTKAAGAGGEGKPRCQGGGWGAGVGDGGSDCQRGVT